jgi:diadenosine tetraphosphate (Ap4A) HIT family hydrolase
MIMPATGFRLAARLSADTFELIDLQLCKLLLMNDARFPWLVLVPRRSNAVEIFDLSTSEQNQLMAEISGCARLLQEITGCEKINIGALGNVVKQLHIHIVARHSKDAAWPQPVWGAGNSQFLNDAEKNDFSSKVLNKLSNINYLHAGV